MSLPASVMAQAKKTEEPKGADADPAFPKAEWPTGALPKGKLTKGDLPGTAGRESLDWRKMWGQHENRVEQPGQSTVDKEVVRAELKKVKPQHSTSR